MSCRSRTVPTLSRNVGRLYGVAKGLAVRYQVKNSWGTSFGVDGYFYLARGVYAAGCGPAGILLTNPSYPVMAK